MGRPPDGPLRRLTCPHCQATVGLREETTARRFRCPKCHHLLELAVRSQGSPQRSAVRPSAVEAAATETWTSFPCEVCGTLLSGAASKVGQTVECPDCGTQGKVPAAVVEKAKSALAPPRELYRFQDEGSVTAADGPDDFSFLCGTCNAMVYVRDEQVGTTVPCHDCHVPLVVPPRPPTPEKWKPREVATVPITVGSVAPNTEQIQQAQALLREAERKVDAERRDRPKPPKYPFRTGVLTFPFYPLMFGLWVSLAVIEGVTLALVDIAIELSGGGPMAIMGLLLSGVISVLAIALMAYAATHLLNIIERTADGQDNITSGPESTPLGYLLSIVTIFVAESLSVLPGAILGGLTFLILAGNVPYVEHITWIPALLSRFLLFPIFLLSMLVNDSRANIFSRNVWTSLRDAPKAWRTFYLYAVPVAVVWALTQLGLMVRPNWALRTPLLAANWILLIYYYRLLGRLAWVLEHQWEKWKGIA